MRRWDRPRSPGNKGTGAVPGSCTIAATAELPGRSLPIPSLRATGAKPQPRPRHRAQRLLLLPTAGRTHTHEQAASWSAWSPRLVSPRLVLSSSAHPFVRSSRSTLGSLLLGHRWDPPRSLDLFESRALRWPKPSVSRQFTPHTDLGVNRSSERQFQRRLLNSAFQSTEHTDLSRGQEHAPRDR